VSFVEQFLEALVCSAGGAVLVARAFLPWLFDRPGSGRRPRGQRP
jgi:hypothetical protein